MRLTPFRDNSSSDSSGDESTIQASTSVRVFNYDESSIASHDTETNVSVTDTPPELEWDVVTLLKSRDEPVTIDEIADEIYDADGIDDVEAWGDVHERLSETDLPALDASGVIDFHPDRGTVTLIERPTSRFRTYSTGALFVLALGLLLAPVVLEVTAIVSILGLAVAALGIVATVAL